MSTESDAVEFDSSDLLVEKSLFDIYKKCRCLPRSKFNTYTTLVALTILIIQVCLTRESASEIARSIRSLCDTGLAFCASIMGFLLAGFTIFATMTRPAMLIRMARKQHPQSGLSYLKYNYFSLMEVFICYAWFVGLCFFVKLLLWPNGAICSTIRELPADATMVRLLLAKVVYVFLGTSFIYLLVLLKSFIFNVYHIVMAGLKWDMLEDERAHHKRIL